MKLKFLFYSIVSGLIVIMLVACERQGDDNAELDKRLSDKELSEKSIIATDEKVLRFGFDIRAGLKEDAKQYLPFLKYLEKTTGYRFKLRLTPKDGKIIDDLGKGLIHFAAIGATSYVQAADKYGVKPIVRGVNKQGKAEYRSYLVVRPDSPIKSLTDLYGARFAFGGKSSTQGHLIPRIILQKQQVQLQDLKDYIYTGSHQKCAEAVISGKADVCGMQDTMAEQLARDKQVRILYRSAYYPSSGIVASDKVPVAIYNRVKQALLSFRPGGRDAPGLYHWDKTEMPNGFVEARDADYKSLRQWMDKLDISRNLFFSQQGGIMI